MNGFGMAKSAVVLNYYNSKINVVATGDHGYPLYFDKEDIFVTTHMNRGYSIETVYQIIRGKGKKVAEVMSDLAAGLENPVGIQYFIAEKRVTKRKYNRFMKKIQIPRKIKQMS